MIRLTVGVKDGAGSLGAAHRGESFCEGIWPMVYRLARLAIRTPADSRRASAVERDNEHLLEDALARQSGNRHAGFADAAVKWLGRIFTSRQQNTELMVKVKALEVMCDENCDQLAGVLSRAMEVPFDSAKNQLDTNARLVLERIRKECQL